MAHEFGRMLLALALVLGLLWLFARFARTRYGVKAKRSVLPGGGSSGTAGRIEMLGKKSLGRHTSIAVVKVSDRTLVVGLTPQHITVLTDLSDHDAGVTGLSPLTDQDVELLGWAAPTRDARDDDVPPMPRTAPGTGGSTSKAWDAFVDGLREMTIRR